MNVSWEGGDRRHPSDKQEIQETQINRRHPPDRAPDGVYGRTYVAMGETHAPHTGNTLPIARHAPDKEECGSGQIHSLLLQRSTLAFQHCNLPFSPTNIRTAVSFSFFTSSLPVPVDDTNPNKECEDLRNVNTNMFFG